MDILFSPYAVGAMPKSAMAEVERRTEDLLKSSSFQRMVELEKKYKTEQSRASPSLLSSSQFTAQLRDGPSPRPERPESSFPKEQFLMVNPTRRPAIPPALSLAIPQAANSEGRSRPEEWEAEDEDSEETDSGTPTYSEPSQKQVKFLAPEEESEEDEDEEEDEEDGKSEQSSICQSPSWEGYGQRKKDKKLEAERRKKEKERAEKEAKAAKKRNITRLSKAPPPRPPATTNRESRSLALTAADRSMSDPVLLGRRGVQSAQSFHRPEEVGRTVSADDVQQIQRHRPAVTEVLSMNGFASEGPGLPSQEATPAVSSQNEKQSSRDAFPPSASKTPKVRHMSPSGHRGNSLSQGLASANNSQETLSGSPRVEGPRRNGYVHQQRVQAAERAMAGFADEQLFVKIAQHYPPSSSSSGHSQHTRRSSLTQEAKSAAMKLVGMKTPSSSGQADYLTFKAIPYSSGINGTKPTGSMSPSPNGVENSVRLHEHERPPDSGTAISREMTQSATSERPSPPRSSISSNTFSMAGSELSSHGREVRDSKDSAMAAMPRSVGNQQKPVEGLRPSVPLPPYYRLRALMHSRASARAERKAARSKVVSETTSTPKTEVAPVDQAKPAETGPNGNTRASEGSSSSSACEDGSQLPSPTITPDTSRPQSAKDVLLATNERTRNNGERAGVFDDERTLHQSLDSSKSSTPRAGAPEARGSVEVEHEDRWSRTALPFDADGDAQSFMTTVSNLDSVNVTEQEQSKNTRQPQAKLEQPRPIRAVSRSHINVEDAEPVIVPPPRSRKRSKSSPDEPQAAPPSLPSEQRQEGNETTRHGGRVSEDSAGAPRSKGSSKLRGTKHRTNTDKEGSGTREGTREMYEQDVQQQNHTGPGVSEMVSDLRGRMDEDEAPFALGNPQREWIPSSVFSASFEVPSFRSISPEAATPDYLLSNNPYFADFSEVAKAHSMLGEMPASTGPPSPISLPSPIHQVPTRPSTQPRTDSGPAPSLASGSTSRASTPSSRPSGTTAPISILKQPKSSGSDRPPVLSAIPKHMQLQAGMPARSAVAATAAPVAKIFVECCSCKFYHDMPSKLYECMAKPDAVVEDKLLGISGAITTMVKCPWCQHNMSRGCCAGYAAVVYLKEKLH
ncbi:hypothetical protein C7999DRAFT_13603 [Corynascus novoguineensis]|uniref:Uncharacterized protein n=1 Tax=Corynascus novoguineensis TaxID=1126955 RepID=A0AAN7CUA1_9PEZI|nr:hypothetical protein C7999DRAFT_13603 [Corynascus novoguineensis]